MRGILVLTAIILGTIIVSTNIYALKNPRMGIIVESPEELALAYIREGPTFSFDGIPSSLNVTKVDIRESHPLQYVVTILFQCLHGGYGNRTDQILTQVITPHTAVVTVVGGKVMSAVLDGSWNEVAQRPIENDDVKPIIETMALGWLVNAPTFKFDGVAGSVKVVDSWLAMTFAAPSFWGVTIEFDCQYAGYGDRSKEMLTQVITHHVAAIHVTEGVVNFAIIDDVWDEVKQTMIDSRSTILSQEEARDIVVKYLIDKLGIDAKIPKVWTVEDLAPKLLGVEKTRYAGDDWDVIIEYAVVWKPVYTVTVEKGSEMYWKGKVDQSGSVISD